MRNTRMALYSLILGVVMILGSVTANAARVFVSSSTHDGDLGGLVGGDQICQGLADAHAFGGTWIAWLSSSTTKAADRLVGNGPFVLAAGGGGQIAVNRAALLNAVSTSLELPINVDELGNSAANEKTWTGTDPDGESAGNDCTGWITNSANVRGEYGDTDDTDEYWTADGSPTCNVRQRLYCSEQAGAAPAPTPVPALTGITVLIIIFALLLVGWNNIRRDAVK